MKKIILVLMLILSSFFVHTIINANSEPTNLVIHYFRYDDSYTGFNVWLWAYKPVAGGGVQHDFNPQQKDEKGAYINIDLTAYNGTTEFGIIVKEGGWDGYREPGGDRFFDLSKAEIVAGEYHVFS